MSERSSHVGDTSDSVVVRVMSKEIYSRARTLHTSLKSFKSLEA